MVEVQQAGDVGIVLLGRPKVNAIDPPLLGRLHQVLDGWEGEDGPGAMLLASSVDRVFSAGFDLKVLGALGDAELGEFFSSFATLYRRLYTGPVPVVAAVAGHALAGGAILALACDRRVFGQGDGQFGLTEVDLGLPVPEGVLALLRGVVGDVRALEVAALGRCYRPEEALEAGFAQRLVPHDRAFPEALREAQALAAKPRAALREIRAALRRGVREQLSDLDAHLGETFVRWWRRPEVARRRDAILQGRK